MKTISKILQSRIIALPLLGLVAVATIAPDAKALPRDRSAGRAGARDSRQDGRQEGRYERRHGDYGDARDARQDGREGARDSRQIGRQVSRARWRGCYALPRGAVIFSYGGYRYYRVGPRFYYPYMYGGRTVYIDINVSGGNPVPPPPAASIDIDIY